MKFQVNEGPLDRLIRIVVGGAALGVAAVATPPLFYGALVVALIGLATGITGFCLTYALLGISTLPKSAEGVG